jgi:hypothetical protein
MILSYSEILSHFESIKPQFLTFFKNAAYLKNFGEIFMSHQIPHELKNHFLVKVVSFEMTNLFLGFHRSYFCQEGINLRKDYITYLGNHFESDLFLFSHYRDSKELMHFSFETKSISSLDPMGITFKRDGIYDYARHDFTIRSGNQAVRCGIFVVRQIPQPRKTAPL